MSNNTEEINQLIKLFSKLPGLGSKSAKRIVLKLINNKEGLVKPLANNLLQVYKNVVRCNICGNIKSSNAKCSCSSKKQNQICVVENIADMWVIESTGLFQGYYHILGGTIASNGKNDSQNLLINSLLERVKKNSISEVILATSATVEGQTTAFYIANLLKDFNIKISKLAQGLPVGGEIEFLDDSKITLSQNPLEPTIDPWKGASERFKTPSEIIGKIKAIKGYGIFVDIGEGLVGLLHVSEFPEGQDINELNIEVERLRGDIKLVKQSIETIETNHLVHLDRKVNKINNILWTVGLMIFAQLIITIKSLII